MDSPSVIRRLPRLVGVDDAVLDSWFFFRDSSPGSLVYATRSKQEGATVGILSMEASPRLLLGVASPMTCLLPRTTVVTWGGKRLRGIPGSGRSRYSETGSSQ